MGKPQINDRFRQAIRASITSMDRPTVDALEDAFRDEVRQLARAGVVDFAPPEHLIGFQLECKVKCLLEDMGLPVELGRDGREDLRVSTPDGFRPACPLVVEIKGSKGPAISRDDLRQLDDWVFELSGEAKARKSGLTVGSSIVTGGLGGGVARHPTRHKGVLVFNGPVGQTFAVRGECAGANEIEFASQRDFCVMPLAELIHCAHRVKADSKQLEIVWKAIHETEGVFREVASPHQDQAEAPS